MCSVLPPSCCLSASVSVTDVGEGSRVGVCVCRQALTSAHADPADNQMRQL